MPRRKSAATVRVAPVPSLSPASPPAEAPALGARSLKLALSLILAVFAILAWMYSAATPAATADQHNPDENAHMLYVSSVGAGHLPVFHAGDADYEAHQPPLYYVLCAPIYDAVRGSGPAAATRAVRCVSLALGLGLIITVFLCVRALFPAQPLIALGTAAFVAWLPMNISLCASVTNDALVDLVMALALWRLTVTARAADRLAQSPPLLRREALLLAALIGIGIWTKTSTLLLVPTVACACYFFVKQGLLSPRAGGTFALLSVGVGFVIGAPWLLRNQALYGDPLAQHLFETAFRNTAQAPDLVRYVFGGSFGAYLWGVARWTFASFWGVFDSMRLFWGRNPLGHPPSPAHALPFIYTFLAACSVASLAGLGVLGKRLPSISPWQAAILQTFGVLVALTWIAHLRFVLVFFQAQGRYWYPALLPLALFFVLGLRGLAPRPLGFGLLLISMTLGLLGLNVYTLGWLLPARFGH